MNVIGHDKVNLSLHENVDQSRHHWAWAPSDGFVGEKRNALAESRWSLFRRVVAKRQEKIIYATVQREVCRGSFSGAKTRRKRWGQRSVLCGATRFRVTSPLLRFFSSASATSATSVANLLRKCGTGIVEDWGVEGMTCVNIRTSWCRIIWRVTVLCSFIIGVKNWLVSKVWKHLLTLYDCT